MPYQVKHGIAILQKGNQARL